MKQILPECEDKYIHKLSILKYFTPLFIEREVLECAALNSSQQEMMKHRKAIKQEARVKLGAIINVALALTW